MQQSILAICLSLGIANAEASTPLGEKIYLPAQTAKVRAQQNPEMACRYIDDALIDIMRRYNDPNFQNQMQLDTDRRSAHTLKAWRSQLRCPSP